MGQSARSAVYLDEQNQRRTLAHVSCGADPEEPQVGVRAPYSAIEREPHPGAVAIQYR